MNIFYTSSGLKGGSKMINFAKKSRFG